MESVPLYLLDSEGSNSFASAVGANARARRHIVLLQAILRRFSLSQRPAVLHQDFA
jgi:hypothetical protein